MDTAILVSTTFERQEHAEDLARILLNKKLVACAQIHGPVKSMFWWKDDVAESVEFILLLKSFAHLYQQIEQIIVHEHPYDVPEIIAESLLKVSPSYLKWMREEIVG